MTAGKYPKSDGEVFWARDANMAYYQGAFASVLNYAAVSVATTATIIVSANSNRKSVLIRNNSSQDIFIGDDTVTTSNGLRLKPNHSIYLNGNGMTDVVYGIVASSTADTRYLEAEQ